MSAPVAEPVTSAGVPGLPSLATEIQAANVVLTTAAMVNAPYRRTTMRA